jgi:tetratricopeptide (TPR) repeat protein
MKSRPLIAILAALLTLSATSVLAQDAAWQNSYQLEAAGKYYEAITALDHVPANGPDAELKALRRGWLFYLPGSFNESIREYRLAIEHNSHSIDARLGVTLPLLALKRWRDAAQNAKIALDLAPNNYTALLRLTVALEGQHEWDDMAKTAAVMVASYPSDATAYVYLARAKVALLQRDDAIAAYSAVLVRAPGNLEAKNYLEKK